MGGGGVTAGLARERAHLPVTARAREAKTARGGALKRGRGGGGVPLAAARAPRVPKQQHVSPETRSWQTACPTAPLFHGTGHVYCATMRRDEHRLSTERRRSVVQTSASTVRCGLYRTVCTAMYVNTQVGISNVASCLEMDQADWIHKWVGGGGVQGSSSS